MRENRQNDYKEKRYMKRLRIERSETEMDGKETEIAMKKIIA